MSTSASGPQSNDPSIPPQGGQTGWERPAEPGPDTYSAPAGDPWGAQATTPTPVDGGQSPYGAPSSYPTPVSYGSASPAPETNPYGQQQYGAAAYGSAPAAQPGYGQQTTSDGIPPYVPPQQQVVSPYGAYPTAYQQTPPPPAKPSKLGLIGLILALVALVGSVILSAVTAGAYGELAPYLPAGNTSIDANSLPEAARPAAVRAGVLMMLQAIPSVIGLAALICSAIGLTKPGPKVLAVLGLVLSILAPVISFVAFSAMLAGQMPVR